MTLSRTWLVPEGDLQASNPLDRCNNNLLGICFIHNDFIRKTMQTTGNVYGAQVSSFLFFHVECLYLKRASVHQINLPAPMASSLFSTSREIRLLLIDVVLMALVYVDGSNKAPPTPGTMFSATAFQNVFDFYGFALNKRSFRGPGGVVRRLDSVPWATICARVASRGLPLTTGRKIYTVPKFQIRYRCQNPNVPVYRP